jgi:hypothetical protein
MAYNSRLQKLLIECNICALSVEKISPYIKLKYIVFDILRIEPSCRTMKSSWVKSHMTVTW